MSKLLVSALAIAAALMLAARVVSTQTSRPGGSQSAPPAASAVILGTVVDAATNAPVPSVVVTLSPARSGTGREPQRAITGPSGRFAFRSVIPGSYTVTTTVGGNGYSPGGFVVTGEAPLLVLVRAAGPALTGFGVPDVLAAPVLTVLRGDTIIAQGAAWSDGESAAQVAAAAARTSAFPLASGSADAALLLFLEPGAYTAHIRGQGDTTGIALVEIYVVPDP